MCANVNIRFGDRWEYATTKAELREVLGAEPVQWADYFLTPDLGDWEDDCCLCPCDMAATAKAAGYVAARDSFGDWEFTRPPASEEPPPCTPPLPPS